MNTPIKSLRFLILSGFALLLAAAVLRVVDHRRLPAQVGQGETSLPVLSRMTDFRLTNQLGTEVTLDTLHDRVWVGDIIFTRCPGPCVRMSETMRRLHAELPSGGRVGLFSLTADPVHDTPEVLGRYAERFGADPGRWLFLSGSQDEIYRLATQDLLLVVADNQADPTAPPEDLFLHSTKLVVIDGEGQVRAAFDGEDASSVKRVTEAVHALLEQEQGKSGKSS
ncbi:MAG: SCO family protein [Limisphaerales bacterium]